MTLSTRIGVMNAGAIVQVGEPAEIYEYPNSRFVADFIGSVNMFEGRVTEDEPDTSACDAPEAGGEIYVGHGVVLRAEPDALVRGPAGEAPPHPRAARRGAQRLPGGRRGGRLPRQPLDLPAAARRPARCCRRPRPTSSRCDDDAISWDETVWVHLGRHRRRGADAMSGADRARCAAAALDRRAACAGSASTAARWSSPCRSLWLLVFFLIPFLVVAKISLSEAAIAMPPYLPLVEWDDGRAIVTLNFGNFTYLFDDPLYLNAYLSSLRVAFISALLALLVGYPMAYYIARSPDPRRSILLTLVILPFWTSFLLRVYAWQGFLRSNGVINNFLLWTGIIDQPLVMLQTDFAVYLGIVYTYLPFMILPLYANLVKLDESLLEASADLGGRPLVDLLPRHAAALDAGDHRRLHAGLRAGDRRVRDPRAARRAGHADDRPGALERVLLQPRLAGGERGGHRHAGGAGGPDHDPAHARRRRRRRADARVGTVLLIFCILGFVFLYAPILSLIIFSFNESQLVTVWGGFSTKWYGELLRNPQILGAAWISLQVAVVDRDAGGGARHARGLRADALRPVPQRGRCSTGMSTAPLVMPEVITGLSLLLLFVAMEQLIGWPAGRGMTTIIIAHVTFCMAYVDGGGAVAARRHGPEPRGGGDGPRRAPGAGVLRRDHPGDRAGAGRRLAARLHPVARRPGGRELRHRARAPRRCRW